MTHRKMYAVWTNDGLKEIMDDADMALDTAQEILLKDYRTNAHVQKVYVNLALTDNWQFIVPEHNGQDTLYDMACVRVMNSDLKPHYDVLLSQGWSNYYDHLLWIIKTDVHDIAQWVKAVS